MFYIFYIFKLIVVFPVSLCKHNFPNIYAKKSNDIYFQIQFGTLETDLMNIVF